MDKKKFDLAVIGSGPGGYPAAIKAAQMGKSVALIEAGDTGGTCLNRGCIPTKTLLANTATLNQVRHAHTFGIEVGEVSFDYSKMAARKDEVVGGIRKGLETLIRSNKITLFKGHGKFTSPKEIKVLGEDNALLEVDQAIIATGSEPRNIPAFPFDGKKIHSSTSILELTELPQSIVIIGAGYIGCEFACLFQDLGVQVEVLEMLPRLLPMEEINCSKTLQKIFHKRGIGMRYEVKVASIDTSQEGVVVHLEGGETLQADMALVSVGRKLNSDGIGLDKAGVPVDERGAIPVNTRMETAVPGIYAIGDVTAKWMLAHVASHQGLIAGTNAAGGDAHMHYDAVPSVVFTHPEIGTVGLSLEQAKEKGHAATLGQFPFQALGKSQAAEETEGFAQIVVDENSGQILGAQVIGHEASTLIAEMAVAIANELTVECLSDTIHAHPTIAESWMEAALVAQGSPLHIPPKRPRKKKNSQGA